MYMKFYAPLLLLGLQRQPRSEDASDVCNDGGVPEDVSRRRSAESDGGARQRSSRRSGHCGDSQSGGGGWGCKTKPRMNPMQSGAAG